MTVTVDAVIVLTAGTYMKPSTKCADTFCPFTVTIVSLLKEYPSFGFSIREYTYFLPPSNFVKVGKEPCEPLSEYHAATGSLFSNCCQHS